MKGRTIKLSPYKAEDDGPEMRPKSMLASFLLAPLLKLAGEELLDHFNLANKIKQADAEVVVDDREYTILKKITNLPKMEGASLGFGIQEVELIRRILQAPEIELELSPK